MKRRVQELLHTFIKNQELASIYMLDGAPCSAALHLKLAVAAAEDLQALGPDAAEVLALIGAEVVTK